MSIKFLRIDDRMIHGQTVTRWAKELPCDGLIAVNDETANNPVLKQVYKTASDKKTFVWTKAHWTEKAEQVLSSDKNYFLITKNPTDMKEILIDQKLNVNKSLEVIVGPLNDRPDAIKLGNNQSITQQEADALQAIETAGYKVKFQLLPDVSIGYWSQFKGKFGY